MLGKAPIRQEVFEETPSYTYMSNVSEIRDALRTVVLHYAEGHFKAFAVVRHPERVTICSKWQIDLIQCSTPVGKVLLKVGLGDVLSLEDVEVVVAAIDGGTVISSDECKNIIICHNIDKLASKRRAIDDLVLYAQSSEGEKKIFSLHERTTKLMQAGILNRREAIPSFSDFALSRSVFRFQRASTNRDAAQRREYIDYVKLKIQWLKDLV